MSKNLQKKISAALKKRKLKRDEVRKTLKIKGEESVKQFDETLDTARVDGKFFKDKKGFYHNFDSSMSFIQGQVFIDKEGIGHFTGKKDGNKVKFIIMKEDLNGALDGDIVIISDKHRKKYDAKLGRVEEIIQRNKKGHLFKYIGEGLFKLYDETSDIYLYKNNGFCKDFVPGLLVYANLENTPVKDNIYNGEVTKIFGHVDDPDSLIYAIGYKYGFDYNFSDKAIKEAESLPKEVTNDDFIGRKDLTDELIFTIDGENTKDRDDAISIKKDGDNYILKVHIADVSHYLKDKPNLIKEILNRGNSAYLADSVFPMLPHIISNGICSLNPNVDRLVKTKEITINKYGDILGYKYYKSVINSKKAMTYKDVNKVLKNEYVKGYEPFVKDLHLMNELSKILKKNRSKQGSITFSSDELKIITDINGNVINIGPVVHSDAEEIIENFMIVDNTVTTEMFGNLEDIPFIYRVHEKPDAKLLLDTLKNLKNDGIEAPSIDRLISDLEEKISSRDTVIKPKYIESLLDSLKNTPYYETVSDSVLRSMKKAIYSQKNTGHFGLANDNYSHFTSPIRRAADFINHYIIDLVSEYYSEPDKERSKEICQQLQYITKKLPDICEHISLTERLADKAEEEASKLKRFQYFEDNIADYDGPEKARILSISKAGIKAKLGIFEVMVPSSELYRLGFNYRKESRSYTSKKESIRRCDEVYLFYPETAREIETIYYNNISKDEESLLPKPKEKTLRRKHIINKKEN